MVSDIPQAEAGGFLASGSLRLDWTIGEMMSQKKKKRKKENGERRIMFIMMKTRRLRDSRLRGEVVGLGKGRFNLLMGWFLPLFDCKR